MERVLSGLEPKRVFEIFEDIAAIPHGSGNTNAISDYCVKFARDRGLTVFKDGLNNVIIKKPASAGYETHEPVVLQGHLDMVCEKDPGVDFDFERDGLRLKLEGDKLHACGTTLGGDDGVAIAMTLAVIDDETLPHPPIEAVFTSDEETGMFGAAGLDVSKLSAKRFISLDHGDSSLFTVGCAGGVRVNIDLPVEIAAASDTAYKVTVSGLKGGHSGEEIDKGGLNANKVLAMFLRGLPGNIRISEISGGDKDNAIPVNSSCVVFADADVKSAAEVFVKENYCPTDAGLSVSAVPVNCGSAFTASSTAAAINLLNELPNGIQAMSGEIEGLVETSLNIGVMRTKENAFCLTASVRSSKAAEKAALTKKLKGIADRFGAGFSTCGDYPAWEYKKESPLRDTMISVFEKMFGKTPGIKIIHAGLECGLFSGKIKDIDAVSAGPDLFDIHTSRESLSVSSLARTYKYLCKVLEEL
ncbi:MAG: aminoacyl-histidine dipeptidase [Clostridia bacterium]|nr:aminoacyl-histidine dipeptidase [Clostridia bacterium]